MPSVKPEWADQNSGPAWYLQYMIGASLVRIIPVRATSSVAPQKRLCHTEPQGDKVIQREAAMDRVDAVVSERQPPNPKVTMPRCPGCGWHDVRRSRPKFADAFLSKFAIIPF